MELRQLRAFIAVAETESFTAAADRLVVVQSAVSATIRGLEQELQTTLFDRSTRSVALSDAGRALLPEARATLESARLAADAVAQVDAGLRGTISVGIMQGATQPGRSIARYLADFHTEHPAVVITARHLGGSQVLAEGVRDGLLDLALLSLPADFPGVHLHELDREPMMLACRADHPLAERKHVAVSELADHPFIDTPPGWGNRLAADRVCAENGITRTVRYELNDATSLAEFVQEGLGVALLFPSMVAHAPDIRLIALKGAAPVFRTLLAQPANRRQTAAARAFAASIIDQAGSVPRSS